MLDLPSNVTPLTKVSLGTPLGVHEQISLQASLQAGAHSAHRWISQQGQLVEDTTSKVVSDNREAVIRVLELVLKLIMQIPLLFLGPDHVHNLSVLRKASRAIGITF